MSDGDAFATLVRWDALEHWMRDRGIELFDGPREIQLLRGGTQNVLISFMLGDRRIILRRPSAFPTDQSNRAMLREAQILGALEGTEVPHPTLIAACSDREVIGANFYLMDHVPGVNVTTDLSVDFQSSSSQHGLGLALVDGILTLSNVDPARVGLSDFGRTDNFLERQVQRWAQHFEKYAKYEGWDRKQALPNMELIGEWLTKHQPTSFAPGIMHGDYHLGNVLFSVDGSRLSAIVDWELSALGDPLLDLGWLLATWPDSQGRGGAFDVQPWIGFPTREQLIQHYARNSGRDLGAIDWYEVLACYKLSILNEGTAARATAGLAPVETGDRLHRLALALVDRAHHRIETKSSI